MANPTNTPPVTTPARSAVPVVKLQHATGINIGGGVTRTFQAEKGKLKMTYFPELQAVMFESINPSTGIARTFYVPFANCDSIEELNPELEALKAKQRAQQVSQQSSTPVPVHTFKDDTVVLR